MQLFPMVKEGKRNNVKLSEIKQIIEEEKEIYVPQNFRFLKWSHQKRYLIWKCLSSFRLEQFWKRKLNSKETGKICAIYAKLAYRYYSRQKNIYGAKAGVEISNTCVLGRRLDIWHGGVILSGSFGNDCVIHGNNVVGNKGNGDLATPVIGDGVDLGVGAVIIGGVHIADGCRIGANAVVTKDFPEENQLIIGIPARVKGK